MNDISLGMTVGGLLFLTGYVVGLALFILVPYFTQWRGGRK